MSKPRLYLLVVISPALDSEHARIEQAVTHHAGGDFVQVWKQAPSVRGAPRGADTPFSVGYLFSTTTPASKMGFGLLERDSYLLVEVTGWGWLDGFSKAQLWLERHRESP